MKVELEKKPEAMLDDAGLKKTRPRLAILGAMQQAKSPLTQEQIAEALGDNAPNKVTIYRALESLSEAGIIHQAYTKNRSCYFELGHNCSEHQCHPHFTCTNCNQTQCMVGVKLPMAKLPEKGFAVKHQKIELQGLCPKCNDSQ